MEQQGSLVYSDKNLFSNAPPYVSYFIFLIFISIITVILDHKYQKLEQIRAVVNTVLYPVYLLNQMPLQVSRWFNNHWIEKDVLLDDIDDFNKTNKFLNQRLQKFEMLEVENQRLRNLLGMSNRYQHDKVQIASVLRLDQSKNPNELTLDKGIKDGVYLDQPVLDDSGLLGRVVHLSYSTSKLLLLTSTKHYTPVQIVRNFYRSTSVGSGFISKLDLLRVPENVDIQIGDSIITSGMGEVFPRGYKVGKVTKISKQQDHFIKVKVEPYANSSQVQEVLLIWPQNQ